MKRRALICTASLLAALASGCEDDDNPASVAVPAPTNAPTQTKSDPATELAGIWKGPAGTGQQEATLDLLGYALVTGYFTDGTVTWANGDIRDVRWASYDPPNLTLSLVPTDPYDSPPTDTWSLKYDGTHLEGKGEKISSGEKYDILMRRAD